MVDRQVIVRVKTVVLLSVDLPYERVLLQHAQSGALETLEVLLVVDILVLVTEMNSAG